MKVSFKDQIGNTVLLRQKPRRIISLVPSQTELLFDLDLDEEIVGITRFCIRPETKCQKKTKIGGTKKFNFELIDGLGPDLIIGNKEENYKEGIRKLGSKYPLWMSDIITIEDALDMIKSVGEMVGKSEKAGEIISVIKTKMHELNNQQVIKVAYLIWKKPYMAAARNTFINEMLKKCGLINVFEYLDRYSEVTLEQIKEASPDAILLSSEPYPFKMRDVNEFRAIFPGTRAIQVDGQMFSWYGSRLRYAPDYFKDLRGDLAKWEETY